MAEKKITDLTSIGGSTDRTTDVVEIVDTSANESKKATVNQLLGITGAPVGDTDSQTLTTKTLDNTNTVTLKDTLFTLQDDADTTKQARFQLSGITTGTIRTYTLPNGSSTLVDLSTAQTLTNKTLTSPIINTATIANPTLTVDTISEFTSANGVTIDGVLLKDSKVNGSYITDDTITDTILDYPRWWQEIGRTTLVGAGDTISVSIPARKYLYILASLLDTGGAITGLLTFNGDTATNYAHRVSQNGGADSTSASRANISLDAGSGAQPIFAAINVINIATAEKLAQGYVVARGTAGAANLPNRSENFGKWANTTNQITTVTVSNGGAGDYAVGSGVVVLGHD